MNKIVIFPGPFISIFEVKNHKKIKSRILSYIKKDINNPFCNRNNSYEKIKTSYDVNNERDFKFKECMLNDSEAIKNIVWEPLDYFINNCPFFIQKYPQHSSLEDIWFNEYQMESFFVNHCHPGSTFSGIYLLDLEDKNNTQFYSCSSNNLYQNITYSTEDVKEGHVILFPSEMFHEVPKINSKKITLSFNIVTR